MFSSAQDEHKHDCSPDHQIEDQAGHQAFFKQEQRCVQQVFDIFVIVTILSLFVLLLPDIFDQRSRKFNGVKSYAKLLIQKQKYVADTNFYFYNSD
jgi:hypothetical protein